MTTVRLIPPYVRLLSADSALGLVINVGNPLFGSFKLTFFKCEMLKSGGFFALELQFRSRKR